MSRNLAATRAARLKRGVGAGRECAARYERSNDWPQGGAQRSPNPESDLARSAPHNPDRLLRNFLLVFFVLLVDTPRHEEYTTHQTAPWKPSFSRVSFSAHYLPWRRSCLVSLATAR